MKRKPYSKPEIVLLFSATVKGKGQANSEATNVSSLGANIRFAPLSNFPASNFPDPAHSHPVSAS